MVQKFEIKGVLHTPEQKWDSVRNRNTFRWDKNLWNSQPYGRCWGSCIALVFVAQIFKDFGDELCNPIILRIFYYWKKLFHRLERELI